MTRWLLAAMATAMAATAGIAQVSVPKPFSAFSGAERVWLDSSRAISSHTQVTAGQAFHVALDLHLAKGWSYDSPDPGEVGLAAGLKVDAGKFAVGEPLWPADKPVVTQLGTESIVTNAYEGRVVIYVPITVPAGTPQGDYTASLTPTGQVCTTGKAGQCVPLEGPNALTESVTVKVGDAPAVNPEWNDDKDLSSGLATAVTAAQIKERHAKPAAITWLSSTGGQPEPIRLHGIFSKQDLLDALNGVRPPNKDYTVLAALALALLAGLILNIMPCVLPVIPLKVLSIAQMAGTSRWQFVKLSLAFIAGIMLFFAGLAVVNIIVHEVTRHALNWGEHFQSTGFRIAMAMVVVAVAANLFGVFNVIVPTRIASLGDEGRVGGAAASHGVLSAIGGGILTAVLSTPCSFGYLTTAFAWAQAQPLWLGSVAILLIGVGMALPYIVLMAFPGLVSRLPRPGRWMELFKQSMGFVMALVAVWLIGTLTADVYPVWVIAYATVLAFCLWVWGTWVRYDAPLGKKIAVRGIAAAIAVAAGIWMLQPPKPLAVKFEPFDEVKLVDDLSKGKIVLVDFTANWCLTCKTVEELVYNDASVAAKLKDHRPEVVMMKGDITTRDLPANRMLFDELKEPGVPVSVIFPPTGAGAEGGQQRK